jgi:ABC-type xylose transport system substrate-binding protein
VRKVLLASLAVAGLGLSTVTVSAAQLIVGVSWNNFQEERWKTDEAAIKAVLDKAGAKYISADAQGSPTKQLADVESLRYMVIRDKVGMGPLEPFISDPWIEDISCSGVGPV